MNSFNYGNSSQIPLQNHHHLPSPLQPNKKQISIYEAFDFLTFDQPQVEKGHNFYDSFLTRAKSFSGLIHSIFDKTIQTTKTVWSTIYQKATLDNCAQASIAALTLLGGAAIAQSSSSDEKLYALTAATSGIALTCIGWGIGAATKGQKAKALKLIALAYALGIAVNIQKKEMSKTLENNQLAKTNKELNSNNQFIKTCPNLETTTQKMNSNKKKDESSWWSCVFGHNKPEQPNDTPEQPNDQPVQPKARHIVIGSTYISGNPTRDALSKMVDSTHKECANKWNLEHRVVTDNLLKGECSVDSSDRDCVPYWNKIAVLRKWLNEPCIHHEEWYVMADDDMPVTNMNIDPSEAIDLLRQGKDTSMIVARDVQVWHDGGHDTSVNTGVLILRKDQASKELIESIWKKRNVFASNSDHCRTLGTCANQDVLHEQEAMAMVIDDDRTILNSVLTVVKPRGWYNGKEIAINTFNRKGCFIRYQTAWGSNEFSYDDSNYPEGEWRSGDWMGQPTGVPIHGWYCIDKALDKPPRPIREDKLKSMIAQTVR